MTEDDRRAYARTFAAVGSGGWMPEAVMAAAEELVTGVAERFVLFSASRLKRDGCKWDQSRGQWWIPPRDEPPAEEDQVRPSDERGGRLDQGAGGEPAPRGRPGRGSVRAELADVPDDMLVDLLAKAQAYEAWQRDPTQRRRRWDRRALFLGRVMRAAAHASANGGSSSGGAE